MKLKKNIYQVIGNRFIPASKLPSMNMAPGPFHEIGIRKNVHYKFSHNWDLDTYTILEENSQFRHPNGSLDGYRLFIQEDSKLFKYKDQYYYIGGFMII